MDLSETVKAVFVAYRRACAFVMGSLQGFMHTCLLYRIMYRKVYYTNLVSAPVKVLWGEN